MHRKPCGHRRVLSLYHIPPSGGLPPRTVPAWVADVQKDLRIHENFLSKRRIASCGVRWLKPKKTSTIQSHIKYNRLFPMGCQFVPLEAGAASAPVGTSHSWCRLSYGNGFSQKLFTRRSFDHFIYDPLFFSGEGGHFYLH